MFTRALWHSVKMPVTDAQLDTKLRAGGHQVEKAKSGPAATYKKKAARSTKKRRIKLTNEHLLGQGFDWVDNMSK